MILDISIGSGFSSMWGREPAPFRARGSSFLRFRTRRLPDPLITNEPKTKLLNKREIPLEEISKAEKLRISFDQGFVATGPERIKKYLSPVLQEGKPVRINLESAGCKKNEIVVVKRGENLLELFVESNNRAVERSLKFDREDTLYIEPDHSVTITPE